jgi:hypothetical protein
MIEHLLAVVRGLDADTQAAVIAFIAASLFGCALRSR